MRITNSLTPYINRLIDAGIIFFSGFAALHLRFWNLVIPNDSYNIFIFGACLVYLLISSKPAIQGDSFSPTQAITRVGKFWVITFMTISLLIIFTQSGNLLSRIWLALWVGLALFFLIICNIALQLVLEQLQRHSHTKKKVAIIGAGVVAEQLIEKVRQTPYIEFELACLIPHIDAKSTLEGISSQLLDEIWIALPISEASKLPELIHQLRFSSASIKYAPDLFTLRLINHGSTEVLGVNMLNLNASPFSGEALLVKNIEDFVISLLILILLSPLLLVLAISVKMTSRGPVFYKQERVGLNGRPFKMLKFRSMPADVEKNGVRWGNSEAKTAHPFSRWMRRMNLDELPQFINVLRGEMSIVGPRPERVEFIEQFSREIPNYAKKHLVKAGITGWAQIHGLRGDTDLNKRIEYDLYYIENWSLSLDLKIILMTAIEPLLPKNNSTR
ncbi:exopolysaccharide biosynthesis polyprenyl glycosylphosphotransferase [Polynucleobacter sp. AP-Capit-er-40B-B4]|uniref:exopolysaccharide biosynthesis polyprenyl glycosylphosphotransferase n=1 Tax=Polynucleobacter sp. AP-Capit-er-40B-B4 TaxID=2576927 RepID=UPI001C0E1AC1|nr:exopolysaccharide biosynthesis polyprenyl glycosylphosphotransferase [Polynucleobacter sp. AP-Capit-er-40B-B4]MBU3580989.1 exopolysaccharide biosynthesis polyprenyl glycosylphosphotransferase [Polynucleobacter sp. AP-Capit-er-40B-B4]